MALVSVQRMEEEENPSPLQVSLLLSDHMSMTGPSSCLRPVGVQRFIDISSLNARPHVSRSPVFSKSAADRRIELFLEVFPLILFVWVWACVYIDDLRGRKEGWGVGGGRGAVIRSGPLTSLLIKQDSNARTSKTDSTPCCYLPVALSQTGPIRLL